MKLRKLLPLATIASTAAIVTPLVTSCGSGYTLDLTKINDYKFVDQAEGSMTQDEATKKYLEAVSKNKKIYADDIFAKIASPGTEIPTGITGKASVKVMKIDVEKHTISATITQKVSAEVEIPDPKITMKTDADETFKIENVPFDVTYEEPFGGVAGWHVTPTYGLVNPSEWATDSNWAITRKGHTHIEMTGMPTEDQTFDDEVNSSSVTDLVKFGVLIEVVQSFMITPSRYLAKVKKA